MIYKNDRDALAYRDSVLLRGDEDCEPEPCEECCTCGDEILSGEQCYRIHNKFICRYCYEDLAEWIEV